MNLASEKGIAKGVGSGRFDPFGVYGAREFITMLYRLTHISEGSDYPGPPHWRTLSPA